jgi:hypothetical protein
LAVASLPWGQWRDDEAAVVPTSDGRGRCWVSVVSDAVIGVHSGG